MFSAQTKTQSWRFQIPPEQAPAIASLSEFFCFALAEFFSVLAGSLFPGYVFVTVGLNKLYAFLNSSGVVWSKPRRQ